MADIALPFRMGEYIAFDRIGRGGMAEIFLALHAKSTMSTKKVVLKKIHPYLAAIPSFVRALMNEAKTMERIRSPFVTSIVDLAATPDGAYIAMEYVEGQDLNQLLGLFSKHRIPVPFPLTFHVVCCVLRGLQAVHETKDDEGRLLDLIHLDLSPGNVLVSFAGEVKICDFGVATTSQLTQILAKDGEIRGKLSYMSPEQAAGRGLDRRSDLFSTGIIFWEMLSGRKLYTSQDKDRIYAMALEGRVPPLERNRFPEQDTLDAILARALSKDPAGRYPTAAAFLDDIMAYVERQGIVVNQIAIGEMLESHFGEEILQVRYERERAISAILPVQA